MEFKDLQFKIKSFEGPLDLLLHLIRRNQFSIYDVPISELLEQYLQYINEVQAQDMEIASEFLEMAAHLIYIKTCSLLPKSEEEKKLKEELTGRLLQLEAIQQIARQLASRCQFGLTFAREPMMLTEKKPYSFTHTVDELLKGMQALALEKLRHEPLKSSSFEPLVSRKTVSVTSKVISILRRLYKTGKAPYRDFFIGEDRPEMVATFLAVLELVKSKRISFSKNDEYLLFDKR